MARTTRPWITRRRSFIHTDCIFWVGAKTPKGYGLFRRGGVSYYAHRAAWMRHTGSKIPTGMCVLHTCDNPPCVNPEHLWLGTNADNVRDRTKKNRSGRSLTAEIVLELRHFHKAGARTKDLATLYNVSYNTVSAVVGYRSWTHLGAEVTS